MLIIFNNIFVITNSIIDLNNNKNDIKNMNINNFYIINYIDIDYYTYKYNNNHNILTKLRV